MKYFALTLLLLIKTVHNQEFPVCDPVDVSWHPHPFNCNRYFLCFWGILHERLCAPELHYNRVTTQCMIPEQAGCEINLDVDCPPSDDEWVVIFIPDSTDCARYFVCFKGEKIPRTCHTNLWWDINNNWCTTADQVQCDPRAPNQPPQSSTTTVTEPTTTTTRPTTTTRNPNTYDCPLSPGTSLHPHTRDCTRYFICTNGIASLNACAPGLRFDYIRLVCLPASEAICFPGATR